MLKGTLIKLRKTDNCVTFRTVARDNKSYEFYILDEELARLEKATSIYARVGASFIKLVWTNDELCLQFTWLESNGLGDVRGKESPRYIIPYDSLRKVKELGRYSVLSTHHKVTHCKMVFTESANEIRKIIKQPIIKRKFISMLRDSFMNWTMGTIVFYDDFCEYSFFWQEKRGEKLGMCGGLILHRYENEGLDKAKYSIHT